MLHGGSLLKPAVSAYRRHSFVEGIRNGGLDVTQNRRSTLEIHYGRTKLPALQRFFLFPSGGADKNDIYFSYTSINPFAFPVNNTP